jgi:GNAT superfamily N-acetyltransferase
MQKVERGDATSVFSARTAGDGDLPLLTRLMDELYSEDPNIAALPRPDISLTLREFSQHPDKGRLAVLECDGEPCGYAILVFFWSNEYGNNIIEIDEVFVDSKFRGRGIGGKFFSWLRSEHAESSAGWSLQVAHKNKDARRLYERLGFKSSRNEHMICIFAEQ